MPYCAEVHCRCGISQKIGLGTYPVSGITLGLADHASGTDWAFVPAEGAPLDKPEDGSLIWAPRIFGSVLMVIVVFLGYPRAVTPISIWKNRCRCAGAMRSSLGRRRCAGSGIRFIFFYDT